MLIIRGLKRAFEVQQCERIKYFDGDYEEDSTSAGTKKYHYISAPTGLVGIFVSVGDTDTLYHVLSDNLGSINAVINSETNEISKYSYSAWGIPRDPDDWTSDLTGDLFAGRGFTGHEHLTEFDLINMNGRVYDPVLARFLSPDPFVQFPGMTDGHNRYAYALNNPLRYTDPSGYYSLEHIIDLLMNSEYGGTWTSQGGLSYFATQGQVSMFVAHDLPALATSGGGGGGTSYVVSPTSIPGSYQYVGFLDYSKKDFFIGKSITGEPIYINLGPSVGVIGMYLLNSTYSANALVQNLSGSWGNTNNNMFVGTKGPGVSSGGASNSGGINQRLFGEITLGASGAAFMINESAGMSLKGLSQSDAAFKTLKGIKVGTKVLGRLAGGADVAFNLYLYGENPSWGNAAKLGVSFTATGLTYSGNPWAVGAGLTIGALDLYGTFDPLYNDLNSAQDLYQNSGLIIVPSLGPLSPYPRVIKLK